MPPLSSDKMSSREATSARTRAHQKSFQINGWVIIPPLGQVKGQRRESRLEPRVMEVLLYLSDRRGRVVAREELLEELWGTTVGGDEALTRAISKLRKAFQDDPLPPPLIETVPKTGYRLVATDAREAATKKTHKVWIAATLFAALAVFLGLSVSDRNDRAAATPLKPTPLTSFPGREMHAALSPDGKSVAFVWQGAAGDNWDIYVQLLEEETPLRITSHPATDSRPAWSPDGQYLAFFRSDEAGPRIMLTPVVGGSERVLTECAVSRFLDLAWSPDGRWIAFSEQESPKSASSIYLLSPETLERKRLTTPPSNHVGDRYPKFSPDSARLAFVRIAADSVQDLFLQELDQKLPERVTHEGRMVWGHAWAKDGKSIIFASNRTDLVNLWRVPAHGGTPEWVAIADSTFLLGPSISVGDRLVYEKWSYDVNIWRTPLAGNENPSGKTERLIASTHWDSNPRYSPDGRKVAFTSFRSGNMELWVSDSDAANPVQTTSFGGPAVSAPSWSPDGKKVAFTARPDTHGDVFIVELEGGRVTRLTSAPSEENAPTWSRDGRWIYFSSDRDGSHQIWRMPVGGGTAHRVTLKGGVFALESPSGDAIYYTKRGGHRIWKLPLIEEDETVAVELSSPDQQNWSLGEKGVYFLLTSAGETELALLSFETNRIARVALLPNTPLSSSLAISPDGQWALFGQMDHSESDLMLVENFH